MKKGIHFRMFILQILFCLTNENYFLWQNVNLNLIFVAFWIKIIIKLTLYIRSILTFYFISLKVFFFNYHYYCYYYCFVVVVVVFWGEGWEGGFLCAYFLVSTIRYLLMNSAHKLRYLSCVFSVFTEFVENKIRGSDEVLSYLIFMIKHRRRKQIRYDGVLSFLHQTLETEHFRRANAWLIKCKAFDCFHILLQRNKFLLKTYIVGTR